MSIEAINWVFKQDDLHNSGAKFVLTVMANYADEHGKCYPSQETLAAKTAMTDRSVRNHLEWLEEHGYITWINRQKANEFTSNLYQLEFAKEKKISVPMSRRRAVRAENISYGDSDGAENISDRDSAENKTDSGRKTFPNRAENISYNTSALKEDTKGGGYARTREDAKPAAADPPGNVPTESLDDFLLRMQLKFERLDVPPLFSEFKKIYLSGDAVAGASLAELRVDFRKFLTQKEIIRSNQIAYPEFDVPAIWDEFFGKCGSRRYPHLRPSKEHFEKWMRDQFEDLDIAMKTPGGGYVNPMTGRGLV